MRLYTAINFFAEVGGYLGLLLGESLISYLIISSKWIQIIHKKLKGKCTKIDADVEWSLWKLLFCSISFQSTVTFTEKAEIQVEISTQLKGHPIKKLLQA